MTTEIIFANDSKEAILHLANTANKTSAIFVITDTDNGDSVIAALTPKTFLGTLPQAIKDELCLDDRMK